MKSVRADGDVECGFWRMVAGIFVVLFAVRTAMVIAFAPEMPFYDEWDGVIVAMAQPMLAHSPTSAFWLALHNEHVMLWSKALSWLQLRISDVQYDNVPVCEVSQMLYAALAAALIAAAARPLDRHRGAFVACALLIVALPYSWECVIASWANPYYFLIAFSIAAIVLAVRARGASGVALVVACMAGAELSMGSGAFAGAVVSFAYVLRCRNGDLRVATAWVFSAVVVLATVAIFILLPHAAPVALHWGWLQTGEAVLAMLLLAPAACLLARIVRGRGEPCDIVFVCVAIWGAMQLGAIMLARPEFRLWYPISRYIDVLACMAFASLACLCRLALADGRTWPRLANSALAFGIIAALACSPIAWHWMTRRAGHEAEAALRIERHIRHGDRAAFAQVPQEILPYPDRDRLQLLLDAPDVRHILGDRLGTRPGPSALVAATRRINARLSRNADWLLALAIGSGLLILMPLWRREGTLKAPT